MRTDHASLLGRVRKHPVYRCRECELTFVSPKPTALEISKLYSSYHVETGQMHLSSQGELHLFHAVLERIQSVTGTPRELLYIGSSYGHFLALARGAGFSAKGLEIASEPARSARDQFGLDVDEKTLEESRFAAGRFSAITLLNVLEHVCDPFATLRECARVARPDAVLVIVVPNLLFAYPFFRATRSVGLEWPVPTSAYDVPFHLSLFSPAALRRLLTCSGWTDISVADAPVISNANPIRTVLKEGIHGISSMLTAVSRGRLLWGYSQIAVARKPKARSANGRSFARESAHTNYAS
jgi:SAM-dependent methyltransferase